MSRVRLRHLVQVNPSCPAFDRLPHDAELTFLPMENIWPDDRLDLSQRRIKSSVTSGYTRFQHGDVLVPKITPTFEASRSVLITKGLVNGVGAGTTELHVLRAGPEIDPRFLLYITHSDPFLRMGEAEMYGVAGQKRVPDDFILNFTIDYVSLEEQRRIADYLDSQTRKISRLQRALRRQISLIEERMLTKAFDAIRGREEPGERAESGLTWLGDIPASWPVMTVSSQFDVRLGKMLNEDRAKHGHLKPYLRVVNVQWDHIDTTELALMDFPPHERRRYEVLPGDLLICEGGSYPGRAAIWDGCISEIYYQKSLHRARSRGRSSVRWLYYCLRIARSMGVFEAEGNTTTMTHLTGEQLATHRFPFPDRSIQDRLVDELDRSAERDKNLVDKLERQLSLIQERKQALITAAVTGQIDPFTAHSKD